MLLHAHMVHAAHIQTASGAVGYARQRWTSMQVQAADHCLHIFQCSRTRQRLLTLRYVARSKRWAGPLLSPSPLRKACGVDSPTKEWG